MFFFLLPINTSPVMYILQGLLLLYGGQPLLAIGAVSHTGAAVTLFTAIVFNYGIIGFS